jgi:Rho-binding antiterminator
MTDTRKPDTYAPIACARYSEYEVAILHRQKLHLRWNDANVHYDETVLPLDLKTANHEEFLVCRTATGQILTIRLDRIHRMEPA